MKKVFIAIVLISSLFTACKETAKSKESEKSITENAEQAEKVKAPTTSAICLLDKLSIRETPSSKG